MTQAGKLAETLDEHLSEAGGQNHKTWDSKEYAREAEIGTTVRPQKHPRTCLTEIQTKHVSGIQRKEQEEQPRARKSGKLILSTLLLCAP